MDILNKVRNAVKVMRKFKEDNRMTSELKISIKDDIFEELKNSGALIRSYTGQYFLEGVPIFVLRGEWPDGYFAVE